MVEELKEKYKKRLAHADGQLEKEHVKGRPKKGSESFRVDVSLFQKWAYRVRKEWYGFNLGDIPCAWGDVLNDFLVWVESKCPDFEILQIKMKFGGLRFYIDTHSKDAAVNKRVHSEISKLEALLRHEKLRKH